MNPAMMQQMQQMQQQMQSPNGNGQAPAGPNSPMNGGMGQRPAYNAQEQLAFEQQKYERQQAQRTGSAAPTGPGAATANSSNGFQPSGSPTSWEGMYDDVPAPNAGGGQGGGFVPRGGFGGRGRGRGGGGGHTPQPAGPSNAPANAPTGPKNAGRPGANYRGGGRGGHRGFHPYARGGGGA